MFKVLDELIGYMRTVRVTGIDMVHSGGDGLAENGDRTANIARRAPDDLVAIAAGELHRAIAHAVQFN